MLNGSFIYLEETKPPSVRRAFSLTAPSPSLKAAAAPGSVLLPNQGTRAEMFLEYLCRLQIVSSGKKKKFLFGYQTIFVGKEDASEICLLPHRQEAPSILVSGL